MDDWPHLCDLVVSRERMHWMRKTARASQLLSSSLDRSEDRAYKDHTMIRSVRIALVLVVIFSVAYVLITPDPTDDVDGILRPNHPLTVQKLVADSLLQSQIPIVVIFRFFASPSCARRLAALELFDFLCVCRC
jgi:hypothetical protein